MGSDILSRFMFIQALGPLCGGILTMFWSWRAIFWFLTLLSGTMLLAFTFFFRDTFRRERSLTYQNGLQQRLKNTAPTSSPQQMGLFTSYGSDNKSAVSIDMEKNLTVQIKLQSEGHPFSSQTKLAPTNVNPFKPLLHVVQRKNNFLVLLSSGFYSKSTG